MEAFNESIVLATCQISPNNNPPERSKGVINVNSQAHGGGIELYPVQRAKALQTVNFRFLNFQETPLQA